MADQQTLEVKVAPGTLIRRSSGSIVGHIWITIAGRTFPGADWDDFPVVILAWWIEALLSVSAGENHTAQCNFMDGPYCFEISAPVAEVSTVRLYRTANTGNELVREHSCQFASLRDAILSAARTTINVCQQKNWVSTDLDQLISVYATLSKS